MKAEAFSVLVCFDFLTYVFCSDLHFYVSYQTTFPIHLASVSQNSILTMQVANNKVW